jgi:hypothetical protein
VVSAAHEEIRVTRRPTAHLEGPIHVEDPTIDLLAEVAGHTDDLAVRRQLFGMRELVSTIIPLVLIALVARNVDCSCHI